MAFVFIKGVITGLILSLPFGPVGIFCLEKTVLEGQKRGFITAMGMVTVDVIYGLTALLFISKIEDFITKYQLFLQLGVGIFLMIAGINKIRKKIVIREIESEPTGVIKDYFTTFFLALANLSGIFTILTIFTFLKVHEDSSSFTPLAIGSGILIGGASEWFSNTFIVSHFTKSLDEDKLIKITQISGIFIFILALFITGNSLLKFI